MKTNSRLNKLLFIVAACMFTACSPEDDNGTVTKPSTPIAPGEQVLHSFNLEYPNAENVEWSMKQAFYVADFEKESQAFRTWFTEKGELMVEKATIPYGMLDLPVLESFKKTNYAGWNVRAVFQLSKKGFQTINEISVTKSGKVSNLYFTSLGDYIRVADDFREYSDAPVTIPQKLRNSLNAMFKDAEIVDVSVIDLIDSEISVSLLYDEVLVTSVFYSNYDWIVNFWDVILDKMPAAVYNGFIKSKYFAYTLLNSRIMETVDGVSYLFYVSMNGKTVIVEFNSKGQPTTELSRSHARTKYLLTR